MSFVAKLQRAREVLEQQKRLSARALSREIDTSGEELEEIIAELIDIQRVARRDGPALEWIDAADSQAHAPLAEPSARAPRDYTPVHLAERIRAEQAALEARGATDGERKTITALFADLKGSTALMEGVDPEEVRAIIDPALQLMMDAVHQYDGYVAQALGDGVFALFGAPLAHEDHPQRAVYAALRMQEAMGRYADTLRSKGFPPLQMRVGLNTGEVVVRSIRKDDLHTDYVPVGHSTNLAARMEQLANPGTIVVSAYTHRLTDGYFAFRDLGPTQVKGVEVPLNIYEVLSVGPLRTRLQVAARRGLTRFVGRQNEMEQLSKALEQAKAGRGQIVGVMGEPGLGKSRLFHEFKLLSVGGCLLLEAYSVSHGKATAYLPVIELLKGYIRIEPTDDERTRREKVVGKVLMLDRSLEDTLPYLFALLGIETQPSPLQQMDAQIRRKRTFEALKKLFLRESLNQPLVLVFEDLHWIDGETQGLLDALSESVAGAKLLLLTNYRPEYRHEWGQKTYYTQLRLAPLGRQEAEELLTSLLGGDANLAPVQSLILEKTQGTPFFIEEVVQTLIEDGVLTGAPGQYRLTRPVSTLQLPSTVQAILAARIDRLAPDEKALLQQLAVIGREFPLSLVRQVIAQPEPDLHRLLASLQRKEFLYEQPAFPEVEYIFKHALTQEVAYSTVLHERRKILHERTGQALEISYASTLQEHYSDLAHHYGRSANTDKAVRYLQLSGEQAVLRSAHSEAISYFSDALNLLGTYPESPERATRELTLRLAVGPPLMAAQGYADPEVAHHYGRARTLCEQLGNPPQLFPVLYGLCIFHVVRGDQRTAHMLSGECIRVAMQTDDADLQVEAHFASGTSSLWRGEFASARATYEAGVAFYQRQHHKALTALYGGYDPGANSLAHMALAIWLLGYPDQALAQTESAISLARELDHPSTLAMVLTFAAWFHCCQRDAEMAQQQAESASAISRDHGFPFWGAWAALRKGGALLQQGKLETGQVHLREGIEALRAGEIGWTYHLSLVGLSAGMYGHTSDGLAAVEEALTWVEKNDERIWEAELYRIKGEFLSFQASSSDQTRAAEKCFLKAIQVAQHQEAKSLELRAATSLARLWQSQGKPGEAHKLLSKIYEWFTEGFDTLDLTEAKALIEEFSSVR